MNSPFRKVSILLSAFAMYGCSAISFPDNPPEAVDKHEYSDFKEGLAIAIQPFTTRAEIEKHFGIDLLSQKVLPVFIIAENRSSASIYIFWVNICRTGARLEKLYSRLARRKTQPPLL